MRILVTGNLGYVGSVLGKTIKKNIESSYLSGLDLGLFATNLNTSTRIGDTFYDNQFYKDVRDVDINFVKNYDVVICLSAVSNDPIGKEFANATKSINLNGTIKLAKLCSESGVQKFILASSCSIYGSASNYPRKESDETNPLTDYAISKVKAEDYFREHLGNLNMEIYCLRFATACGVSDRLRLDLVLNDFVASGIKYGEILILSDGTPLRPIIDVSDMSMAILWAINNKNMEINTQTPQNILSINVGSNEWNFKIIDLAKKVKEQIPSTEIKLNKNSFPDKRSYKVNFDYFKKISGNYYPNRCIEDTIEKLIRQITNIDLPNNNFRNTNFIRLNHLRRLKQENLIDENLRWID